MRVEKALPHWFLPKASTIKTKPRPTKSKRFKECSETWFNDKADHYLKAFPNARSTAIKEFTRDTKANCAQPAVRIAGFIDAVS